MVPGGRMCRLTINWMLRPAGVASRRDTPPVFPAASPGEILTLSQLGLFLQRPADKWRDADLSLAIGSSFLLLILSLCLCLFWHSGSED